jgi:hypothetical protein
MAFEEDDALDQLVGVVHLFDRLGALLGRQLLVAPVAQQAKCTQYWLTAPSSRNSASLSRSMT